MADIKDYLKKLQSGTLSLEEQQLVLSKIEETLKVAKQKKDEAIGQKADMVVSALKQIESRLNQKYDELLQTPAMVGERGPQGIAGKDGKDGLNGRDGINGTDGKDGTDGIDGKDGISIVDVSVDFDGSLVVTLSDGNIIDAGQIFSPEVAQNIQIFKGGAGGTSLPSQTGNSGKYLTTDGSALSWGTVSGGGGSGTVTSVGGTGTVNGITLTGTVTTSGDLTLGGTLSNVSLSTQVTGTLPVANGGTGATTLTGLVVGNGTSVMTTVTAPSGAVVGTTDTQTLTNKRVTNRIGSNGGTTSGNITPTSDTADQYNITGLTGTSAIQIPSGTPTDGQRLSIRIKDDGTGRTLSWVTTAGGYRVIGTTLPLTTTASKTIYVGCVYNVADSFWDVVAVAEQA